MGLSIAAFWSPCRARPRPSRTSPCTVKAWERKFLDFQNIPSKNPSHSKYTLNYKDCSDSSWSCLVLSTPILATLPIPGWPPPLGWPVGPPSTGSARDSSGRLGRLAARTLAGELKIRENPWKWWKKCVGTCWNWCICCLLLFQSWLHWPTSHGSAPPWLPALNRRCVRDLGTCYNNEKLQPLL